jgi:hypothetical protein
MDIPEALTIAFPPSSQLLLDVTRRQIDDGMLLELAEADYGLDAEIHLSSLRPIRDQGVVHPPLGWHPAEVLALTRWHNPEKPNEPPFEPGPTEKRGHQIRAFACAVLLHLGPEYDVGHDSTLAQCLVSTKVLGDEVNQAAGSFLTWRIPHLGVEPTWVAAMDRWLYAFGLLVVASRLPRQCISDSILGDAAAWVLDEETHSRRVSLYPESRPAPFSVSCGFWKPLAAELVENASTIRDNGVRQDLELIGNILHDEF